MRFGLIPAFAGGVHTTGRFVTDLARATESNGFDSVWVGEHVALPVNQRTSYPGAREGLQAPSDAPLPDPLEWLAYAAAKSETLLLGTAILLAALQHPLALAKRVATLDQLSGGRVRLGVGIGWNAQEYGAVAVPFEDRSARMEEYLAAMRVVWREPQPSFDGRFVAFEALYSSPKPCTSSVPILIGGDSVAAARRAGRIGDGYFPFERDLPRLAELLASMRETAATAGRDPNSIEITCLGSPRRERAERLAELGVSRMVVFMSGREVGSVDELGAKCRSAVDGLPTAGAVDELNGR